VPLRVPDLVSEPDSLAVCVAVRLPVIVADIERLFVILGVSQLLGLIEAVIVVVLVRVIEAVLLFVLVRVLVLVAVLVPVPVIVPV